MSRTKHFTHALLSGYFALAANILYTFASVPIALHFLTQAEFGLWALAMQINGYIALIDMGMSGSISRVLIDHKDDKANGEYGAALKTGALVGAVQGLLIVLAGAGLAYPLALLLEIPRETHHEIVWLLIGQGAITGFSFATRIFFHMLVAHQRNDIANHGVTAGLLPSLPVLWIGFKMGLGVYSLLAAQATSILIAIAVNYIGCVRLKLFPEAGKWGRATWVQFKDMFAYGRDLFARFEGLSAMRRRDLDPQ